MAFNDAVAILHPLPGDLDLEGAVDGRRLSDILGKLSADKVKLAVEDGEMVLKAGRSTVKFKVLPVLLPIDSVDMSGEMIDLPKAFAGQLGWVSPSCAKDMSRPALNCVLVDDGKMQASDTYRLSCVEHGVEGIPRLLLPLAQVEVLVDYPLCRVALSEGGEWARFETTDGTTLCARSMAGAFPNLSGVYAVEGKAVKLTAALGDAIDRARVFSKCDRPADEEIQIQMRPNQITVTARYDGGDFSEVVRCEGATEEAEFSIHPKFLAAALETGTTCVLGESSVLFSGSEGLGEDGERVQGKWDHVVALRAK